jgi:hypothetical protein
MTIGLLALRDEVTEAKNFVVSLSLACSWSRFFGEDRATLCALGDAACEKLKASGAALDQLFRGSQPPLTGSAKPGDKGRFGRLSNPMGRSDHEAEQFDQSLLGL